MAVRIVPNLRSTAPGEGAAFYSEVLGLEQAMDLGFIVTYVSPTEPAAQLSILAEDPSGHHPDYSVEVDDVDRAYSEAQSQGREIVYPITDEPWGVRRFFVRDPTGTVANILSHRRSK